MIVKSLVVGPFGCNCTVLGDEQTREAIVIDPGDDIERIEAVLAGDQLKVKAILHTHAHLDHIGATGLLAGRTGAPIMLHPEDNFLYTNVEWQGRALGLSVPQLPPVDKWLKDDDQIGWGAGDGAVVLHTPGHTPGSCCFHVRHPDANLIFSGDTLFQQSIGRTDLPGGDFETIMKSIHGRLLSFDDEAVVIPGHGPATTIGQERLHNPFLNGAFTG